MASPQHILVPFDFSQQVSLAAPYIRELAGPSGRITALSVIPPVWDMMPPLMPMLVTEDGEAKLRDLRPRLAQACAAAFPGLSVQTQAALGDPALKICEFAHENNVDLIMMPTHGFGAFRNLLIGSVTSKVLHDAKCAVWTAAHAEAQTAPAKPRKIMCAVDGASPKTVALVQWAAGFANRLGASLRLLHVVPPISDWLSVPSERKLQEELRTEVRTQIEKCLKDAGLNVPLRVAVGKVSETITEEARQEGDHLVVIGRGVADSNFGRLRSHVYGVIQQSPTPVISV